MISLARRRVIARRLSSYMLQLADSEALSLQDLEGALRSEGPSDNRFFLAYYSPQGVDYALKAYGVYDVLSDLGFQDVRLVVDTQDPFEHRMALYDGDLDKQALLHEMVVRRRSLHFLGHAFDCLEIEWMCLQNPRATFTPERPALPGQEHPGLGIGQLVMDLVQISAERLKLDGLITIPAYFHNAVMYASLFHYLDPEDEARLKTLKKQILSQLGLSATSWAIEKGKVLENENPFVWFHRDQILPLSPHLKAYFHSREYKEQLSKMRRTLSYTLNT